MHLQSILVYLTLIIIMVLCGIYTMSQYSYAIKNNRSYYKSNFFWRIDIILPIILFSILMGMRFNVGYDHLAYLDGYLSKNYIGKDEPLFFLISEISWYFNLHYTVYFGIIAFLQITFFYLSFKDERYLLPFLMFFLFTNGTHQSWVNIIRQSLATCIWLYSLKYIDNKKPLTYLLICLLLYFIHRSALILLFFYPVLKSDKDIFKNVKIQLILLGISFIIGKYFYIIEKWLELLIEFYISILGKDFYLNYTIDNMLENVADSGSGLAYFFKLLLNITIIIQSKKLKLYFNRRRFKIIYSLFFIGLLFFYIFPIGSISFTRPFRYLYIFQTIMYSYYAYYLYKNYKRQPIYLFLLIIIIMTFIGIFILSQYF